MDETTPPSRQDRHRHREKQHHRRTQRRPLLPPGELRKLVPVLVFALIVTLAPLLFGAVDRVVQIGLLAMLAVGVVLRPPVLVPLGLRASFLMAGLLAIFCLKEFGPWQWFGEARWRTELVGSLGLRFPGTHHPQPQNALDALLAGIAGLVWFQWVRTLASERGMRRVMGWALFGAGVLLAVVCFAMGRRNPAEPLIYGLRYTSGWIGWGPMPNRNHTACFLAMAALAGTGCLAWAIVKRRTAYVVAGGLGLLLVVAALLASKSRGGLAVSFAAGLLAFATAVWMRFRSLRTFLKLLAGGAIVASVIVIFGSDVIARFGSEHEGSVSDNMRIAIWRDTLGMWKDAPLFGHGLATFRELYPVYQNVRLDGAEAIHPESSWLLWLSETGVVPLLFIVPALALFVFKGVRDVFAHRGGFFISVGALAGFAGFAAHCAIDVPGHRWATAIYALALLAVACPVRDTGSENEIIHPASRLGALVPACLAAFWAMPLLGFGPSWAAVQPALLLEREERSTAGGTRQPVPRPTRDEWKIATGHFPLNWRLHQAAGLRDLELGSLAGSEWQWHFDVAARLTPSLYSESMFQALATQRVFPGLSTGYWQTAVEKADLSREQRLREGVRETVGIRGARGRWDEFCEARPELLPIYASVLIEDLHLHPADVRDYIETWWSARVVPRTELTKVERDIFHRYGEHWADAARLAEWVKANGARRKSDYREWARLLQKVGDHARAWEVLSGIEKEHATYSIPYNATRENVTTRLATLPDDFSSIATLVAFHEKEGDKAGAEKLILATAAKDKAPEWFRNRAAYIHAARGDLPAAVALLLRGE